MNVGMPRIQMATKKLNLIKNWDKTFFCCCENQFLECILELSLYATKNFSTIRTFASSFEINFLKVETKVHFAWVWGVPNNIYRQSLVKTNQLKNIPRNKTFHILPFTYVTHDNPGYALK